MESLKEKVIKVLQERLRSQLQELKTIALGAHAAAINSELKAESKYDTQGIEASYLAGAHAKRMEELEHQLAQLEAFRPSASADRVVLGSVVSLQWEEGVEYFFIAPVTGGGTVIVDQRTIKIISNQSPLGQALLGREPGESFEFETPQGGRDYEILEADTSFSSL